MKLIKLLNIDNSIWREFYPGFDTLYVYAVDEENKDIVIAYNPQVYDFTLIAIMPEEELEYLDEIN